MIKSFKKLLIYSRILSLILTGTLFPAHAINAQENYNSAIISQPVVAVIDEGINFNHPDLSGSNWVNIAESFNNSDDDKNGYVDDTGGWNFINNSGNVTPQGGHGTKLAGIILKAYPKAKLMPLVVCEKDAGCDTDAIISAIYYAADNGANVINLSLGTEKFSADFNSAIAYAYGKNAVIVAASGSPAPGQSPKNLGKSPISPICNDNKQNMVLGAGSIDESGQFLGFDNFGSCVDVLAFGENVYTTFDPNFENEKLYGYASGTSFAAALVSGSAAALKAEYQNWTNAQIYKAIILTEKNKKIYQSYFSVGALDLTSTFSHNFNIVKTSIPQKIKAGQVKGIRTLSDAKAKSITNIRGPAVN